MQQLMLESTEHPEKLDKAAIVTEEDRERAPFNPWRLCTITQVEEAKCIIRMCPIWLCTIMYSVIFTQMASLFVEQGEVMDAIIGHFRLPTASMSAFDIGSVLACTFLYRFVVVPLAGKISGNPKGLTELQRMGVGLVIGMIARRERGERHGWIPANLNNGHIDRSYFLLFGLALVDLFAFVLFAKWYKGIQHEGSDESCTNDGEKESQVLDKV